MPLTQYGQRAIRKVKQGFTLIELLVVIAIIAILASILFPVFARARENARRASCQSNLKQIGLAMFQYAQDYDEKFPVSEAAYRFPTGQQSSWDLVLQPYIKSYQILKCPSDPAGGVNVPGFSDNMVRSYAVAAYMWEDQESISPVTGLNARLGGRHLAGLPAPAMTLMMADAPSCNGGPSNPNAGTSDWHQCVGIIATDGWATNRNSRPFWGAGAGAEGLHLGTVNLLYADGHVKAKKASTGSAMLDKSAGGHPDTVGPIPPGYSWIWAEADLPKG